MTKQTTTKSKKSVKTEFRYKTEHVDLMLWQYCNGLLDIANSGSFEGDSDTLSKTSNDRFDFLAKQFGVAPSFQVEFGHGNGSFTISKKFLSI